MCDENLLNTLHYLNQFPANKYENYFYKENVAD